MTLSIPETITERQGAYQLFMLALCIWALAALAVETVVPLDRETADVLRYADTGVCVLFFADFCVQLARAPDRWGYFIRWGWLDLLSSIPMVDAFRIGRFARVMRIVRVLRAVRSTRLIAELLLRRRAQGAFLAASLVTLLLIVFASIAILQFERGEGANIKGAQDALWWSFVTITTVGYGDRYPVTWEGRLVAAVLITAGVGLFGAFSGYVASWFLAAGDRKQDDELVALRAEIAALRETMERGERGV